MTQGSRIRYSGQKPKLPEFQPQPQPPEQKIALSRIQIILYAIAGYLGIIGLMIYNTSTNNAIYLNTGKVTDGTFTSNFQMYAFWCAVYPQLAFSFLIGAYIAARAAYTLRAIGTSIRMLLVMSAVQIVVSVYTFSVDAWQIQQVEYLVYPVYWVLLMCLLLWLRRQVIT
jgi:hypothetical protein